MGRCVEALAKGFRLNSVTKEVTLFFFYFFHFLEGGEKHTLLAVS